MSVEIQLQEMNRRLEEHEKRHDREYEAICRKQDGCSKKFELLFNATGQNAQAEAEHKSRLNGLVNGLTDLKGYEKTQDDRIDALGKKMDHWFIGIIVLAAVGYLINFIFG